MMDLKNSSAVLLLLCLLLSSSAGYSQSQQASSKQNTYVLQYISLVPFGLMRLQSAELNDPSTFHTTGYVEKNIEIELQNKGFKSDQEIAVLASLIVVSHYGRPSTEALVAYPQEKTDDVQYLLGHNGAGLTWSKFPEPIHIDDKTLTRLYKNRSSLIVMEYQDLTPDRGAPELSKNILDKLRHRLKKDFPGEKFQFSELKGNTILLGVSQKISENVLHTINSFNYTFTPQLLPPLRELPAELGCNLVLGAEEK